MSINNTYDQQLHIYLETTEMLQHGAMWLGQDGTILGMNSNLVQQLGYPSNGSAPKSIFQIDPHTNYMQWQERWKKLAERRQLNIETEYLTATGSLYPVGLRLLLLQAGESHVCFAIVENVLGNDRYADLLKMTEKISRTGSWEWNLLHEEVVLSEGFYALTNLPPGSISTLEQADQAMSEVLFPADRKKLQARLESAIKSGNPFNLDLAVRPAGQKEPVQMNISTQPVQVDGRTHKMCGVLRDLSDISNRTNELYLTQFCVDNASQLIYWVNPEGDFTYVNQACCEVLGYSKSELLSMNLTDVEPGLTKARWKKRWQELKKSGKLELLTNRTTKSGENIPISLVVNYVDYGGEEYNLAFATDQRSINDDPEMLQLAFRSLQQAQEMIYWLTPDGRFFYFNDTFCQKLGYDREEVEGKRLLDFIPGLSMEEFETLWEKLRQGQVVDVERSIRRKNGKDIPVEATVTLVQVNQKEYSCTTMRDVSRRRKQEADLRKKVEENVRLRKELEVENVQLREDIQAGQGLGNIISQSPNYKPVLRQIGQVADTGATVLILGETGTGKELVANAIHQLSERADRPMVKVNCGALPANLIESELFGHEKGAFTGAFQRKIGRFERAHQSSIFLDEIGEVPIDLQAKLLRVLQEGEFERLGGTEIISVDVRVIAATNRNLEEMSRKGEFREDLFYRLNVFPIRNIPLRERREDIKPLINHFIAKYNQKLGKQVSEIPQAVVKDLLEYEFPGNVRELENLIERAIILSPGKRLVLDFEFRRARSGKKKGFRTMEQMQREHILKALRRTRGKITGAGGAAELLGMKDKTLYSRMTKFGIRKHDFLD